MELTFDFSGFSAFKKIEQKHYSHDHSLLNSVGEKQREKIKKEN